MASNEILENVGELWAEWNIRGFVILSLSLQAFLILFSPLRKSTSNIIISSLIWMIYLSADWVATFLIGHIATTKRDISTDHAELLAFWAAFLLVHLGGPGTITALNLEDNSLWVRHLFSLILQVGTVCYIFVQVMSSKSKLMVPTILIFISGIIKYSERTAALYLASTSKLKDSLLKDSLKLRDKESKKSYDFREGDLSNDDVIVKHAHHLYEVSRGLIVDLIISFDEQDKIQKFFQGTDSEKALKLISAELNFFYEVLYTKASVSNSSLGFLFRCLSLGTVTAALLWYLRLIRDMPSKFDVKLSYALLYGAIAIDGIGLLMIFFSDWPVPKIACFGKASRAGSRTKSYFTIQKVPNWVPHRTRYESIEHSLAKTLVFFRRWSESIPQYSLISYALGRPSEGIYVLCECCFAFGMFIKDLSCFMRWGGLFLLVALAEIAENALSRIPRSSSVLEWILKVTCALKTRIKFVNNKLGLKEAFDRLKYVSREPISEELWKFIFLELQKSSTLGRNPESANRVIGAKKDFVLQGDGFKEDRVEVLHHINGLDYDEIVLSWHIATELLYHSEMTCMPKELTKDCRIFGKILSDYMLYLLVKKPKIMSTVAGAGQIRSRDACTDTCAVAKRYLESHKYNRRLSMEFERLCCCSTAPTIHSLVCQSVLREYEVDNGQKEKKEEYEDEQSAPQKDKRKKKKKTRVCGPMPTDWLRHYRTSIRRRGGGS